MTDVPFCRTLKRGMAGDDVIAHKRAVSRWNPAVYKWHEFTGFYGGALEAAVKAFQKQQGLNQDGVIGPVTHERLERTKNQHGDPVFDATAVNLATSFCDGYGEDSIRDAIVAAGFYWYSHRGSISYSQTRPFQMGKPPWVPDRWDCSAFTTVCHYAGGAPNPNGRPWDGLGYCHEPGALILTSDLRWVTAGEIEVGQELWAFDADRVAVTGRQSRRRFRRSDVLASFPSKKECVRVCVSTGETFICSADHPWLAVQGSAFRQEWVSADQLTAQHRLIRPFETWKAEQSYEAGWLAGMFDGEGWVTNRAARGERTNGIGITQTLGATADRLVEAAKRRGSFNVVMIERPGSRPRINVNSNGGGMAAAAAFLGTVRPERLIANFNIEGGEVFSRSEVLVERVERVGAREVQSIQTSTGTYIAEGFAVHNTGTLMTRGVRVSSWQQLKPGDMIFYGFSTGSGPAFRRGDPTHVALYVGVRDGTPMVLSHGSYPMRYLAYNYRPINHYRHYPIGDV